MSLVSVRRIILNKISSGNSITEKVLDELSFTNEEKELFKDIIEVIKRTKADGKVEPSSEIIGKIEKVFNDAI